MPRLTEEVMDWMANFGSRQDGISYAVHEAVSQYLRGTLTVSGLNRLCADLRAAAAKLSTEERYYTFRSWKAIRSLFLVVPVDSED